MANPVHWEIVTGITNTTYNDTNKISFGFVCQQVTLHYATGVSPISISSNGNDDLIILANDGEYMRGAMIPFECGELWFKGGDATAKIHVLAIRRN